MRIFEFLLRNISIIWSVKSTSVFSYLNRGTLNSARLLYSSVTIKEMIYVNKNKREKMATNVWFDCLKLASNFSVWFDAVQIWFCFLSWKDNEVVYIRNNQLNGRKTPLYTDYFWWTTDMTMLFLCFELPCGCTEKTLRFTCLSILTP